MTQSIELLLDAESEQAVQREWERLAEAGLPTERRIVPSPSHRPHITLWAGPAIAPEVEVGLPALVAGLDLRVRLGALLVFGPRRGQLVVVRQVLASVGLLELQQRLAGRCGTEPGSHFAAGAWTPHVTIARRVPVAGLGAVVAELGDMPEIEAVVRRCRRWDGDAAETWDLTSTGQASGPWVSDDRC